MRTKIRLNSYGSLALLSLAMYFLMACFTFNSNVLTTYLFSFPCIFSNILYYTGCAVTVFWLSDYLRKKNFHANTSSQKLIAYSCFIYLYTLLTVFFFEYCITHYELKDMTVFLESLYIRTITATFISMIYIIKNYGQVIQENTILYNELKASLQKESEKASKAQLGMLKLQLDPHFMFNSLNTLIGLIDEDAKKAETFTLELARIYKYIIANMNENTISLEAGIVFIKNYCNLIAMRYPEEFSVQIADNIVEKKEEKILPLSLQLLIENAIKHNKHSQEKPLAIKIWREEAYVCVSNTLCPYPEEERKAHVLSSGIGIKNLYDRYKIISDKIPITLQSEKEYIVKIPII